MSENELDSITELGSAETGGKKGIIHCLTIIGQVEGHQVLPENTKTTKYIDGEYYWFQNHWDGTGAQKTDGYITPWHGHADWSTKSATWGLFEDIKTGDRYAVISTHMCTRSNNVRALEAIELVDLIEAVVKNITFRSSSAAI